MRISDWSSDVCSSDLPTESEDRETLDAFIDALVAIWEEAKQDIATVQGAPYTMPDRRLDDVRAARQLDMPHRPADCSEPGRQRNSRPARAGPFFAGARQSGG